MEDTRDLLDNVQYTPTRARFKIYLIDEVHMLSNHSFNALLKTLKSRHPTQNSCWRLPTRKNYPPLFCPVVCSSTSKIWSPSRW